MQTGDVDNAMATLRRVLKTIGFVSDVDEESMESRGAELMRARFCVDRLVDGHAILSSSRQATARATRRPTCLPFTLFCSTTRAT